MYKNKRWRTIKGLRCNKPHLPLTENTRHMINETLKMMMKQDAVLINTARGGLIDGKLY